MRLARLDAGALAPLPEFIDKWTAIGLSTRPIDHGEARGALRRLYAAAGLARPRIVWAPCPMTAMLSATLYATIRAKGRQSHARGDARLGQIVDRIIEDPLTRLAGPSAQRRMRRAVERAVAAALSGSSRVWSGFDVALAINNTRRAALDRVLNRALDDPVHRQLDARLYARSAPRPTS